METIIAQITENEEQNQKIYEQLEKYKKKEKAKSNMRNA